MKIKLTEEEQRELTDVIDSLTYHSQRAKNYALATKGLLAVREATTMKILLNHGIAEGKASLANLDKGELEVSNIKTPDRNELAELARRGIISKEQQEKIIKAKI